MNDTEKGFCAQCGERAERVTASCDGCSFIYCEVHCDSEGHDCEAICVECGDAEQFEVLFWGETEPAAA
jgi:hypothetical protein